MNGCVLLACGGTIELKDGDLPGYITSPNYPSDYPQNIDCVWIVMVPNGESVQLDFEDFYIEPNSEYDFISYAFVIFFIIWFLMCNAY